VTTIAVIQPYFFPYAGYFRLFTGSDTVVMFDCVQFPRRGWVHRNRFALASGEMDWLTLPLVKADRDSRIDELRFPEHARGRLAAAMRRFPLLDKAVRSRTPIIETALALPADDVAAYLCGLVQTVATALGASRRTVRSSTLRIDPELRGQDRVIAIVKELGGDRYVNPSGGRDLYDPQAFSRSGIELRFLTPYQGSMESILSRLLAETPEEIAAEISRETILVP
jgi:hypothetical protein